MTDDKKFLVHVHLRGDKRCYWYALDKPLTCLSDRIDHAAVLSAMEYADVSLRLAVRYGTKLEEFKAVRFEGCPMLDELREARK